MKTSNKINKIKMKKLRKQKILKYHKIHIFRSYKAINSSPFNTVRKPNNCSLSNRGMLNQRTLNLSCAQ